MIQLISAKPIFLPLLTSAPDKGSWGHPEGFHRGSHIIGLIIAVVENETS